MSDEIKRKRGRPKTGEVVRNKQYRLMMTDGEFNELDKLSRIVGKSKADLIRESLEITRKQIETERAEKFAYLSRGSDDEYSCFDEYEAEFDDDFD